jgi:hypothetical protein
VDLLPTFERRNVARPQVKPLALHPFGFKPLMPIGFNAARIIRPYGVNEVHSLGQLNSEFATTPHSVIALADLVELAGFHQINLANIRRFRLCM